MKAMFVGDCIMNWLGGSQCNRHLGGERQLDEGLESFQFLQEEN
jgi:hypothetical protein